MLSIQEKKYWVWLSRIPRIGTKTIERLLEKYETLEKIYYLDKYELMNNYKIGEKLAETIISKQYRENLDRYIEYMDNKQINLITIKDKEYPEKLRRIEDHPMYLYTRGNIELLNKKSIAMVGSRNCTDYGKRVSQMMANELVKKDFIIVSGLAKGIDTFSHIGALKNRASTIAVLGSRN